MLQEYAAEINILSTNLREANMIDKEANLPSTMNTVDALLGSIANFGTMLLAYLEYKREEAIAANYDTPAWEAAEDAVSVGYWNGRCDAFNEMIKILSPLVQE
jgi:hypothetical protein